MGLGCGGINFVFFNFTTDVASGIIVSIC